MCGIAGFSGRFEPALLGRMSARIAHRGPDDDGTWHDAPRGVGLAHRRLAIIDLSPLGHQPMWDATRSAAIVFNGEIYNYRELRAGLERDGFRFVGHSDTEVLLNLYLRDGRRMLESLNGIFAFALWDERQGELLLARDGAGVKPLYWSQVGEGLLFASELKALLDCPQLPRDLDPIAVQHHLAFGWCPAPRTMLSAVRKLEAGRALRVRAGRVVEAFTFWTPPVNVPVTTLSEDALAAEVRSVLDEAVRRQMVADVPVGAFLSGGLDSSAVVESARKHARGRMDCFTIGFRDDAFRRDGFADDLVYARRVAKELDVALHEVIVGPEIVDDLSLMIWHLDEPTADPAPLHVLSICRLARERGIKVLLSGTGGDDIFSGYRRHLALARERLWSWAPRAVRRRIAASAASTRTSGPFGRRLRKALRYADLEGDERIASYFLGTEPDVLASLYGERLRADLSGRGVLEPLLATLAELPPSTPPLQRMLHLEGRHFLGDHNLVYADKLSMAVGVEVRVPLLDPDLMHLAASVPPALKQRGTEGKWIFKKAMEPRLPADVVYRPKTGFGAPVRAWVKSELRPLVEDLLSPRSIRDRGLFDASAVAELVAADRRGAIDGAYTVFTLMCVELWCRSFVDAAQDARAADPVRVVPS
ncbi:MAG TPA: asparagine synthase (glutamine-hydrolyzing) [Candidatus Polarisedimenticolaceae bacterium]